MKPLHPRPSSRLAILVLAAAFLPAGRAAAAGQSSWLTTSERQFFTALGADVTVGGKRVRRLPDTIHLPKIASGAEGKLRSDIETMIRERARMAVTKSEKAQYVQAQARAVGAFRLHATLAFANMFFGNDPWDSAVKIPEGVLNDQSVSDLWELQENWLVRALNAQQESDAALDRITGRLEERARPAARPIRPDLRIAYQQKRFLVTARQGGEALSDAVVQFRLRRKSTNGQWVGLNMFNLALLQAMKIRIDFGAAYQSGRLAAAQELAMNQPLIVTQLMPDVRPGQEVVFDLGLTPGEVACLDSISMQVWSADGRDSIEELPGLDEARRAAFEQAQRDYQDRLKRAQAARKKALRRAENDQAWAALLQQNANNLNWAIQAGTYQNVTNDAIGKKNVLERPR